MLLEEFAAELHGACVDAELVFEKMCVEAGDGHVIMAISGASSAQWAITLAFSWEWSADGSQYWADICDTLRKAKTAVPINYTLQ